MSDAPRSKRWWRWADSHRRITCPKLHHIPNTFEVNESGFVRCTKWIDKERRECGCWVFLLVIRGEGVIECEVTLEDKDRMRRLDTPAAMVSYLGIFNRDDEKGAA